MGDFTIEGGAAYTNTLDVSLEFDVQDAVEMRVSEDRDFTDAAQGHTDWVTFAAATTHTLTDSDGLKTLHAQFRDSDGVASPIFSATITLDRAPPHSVTLTINEGSGSSNNADAIVTLGISALDDTSGVESIRIADDGAVDDEPWEPFVVTKVYALADPTTDSDRTVLLVVRDRAGNELAAPVSADVTLDRVPPTLTSFTLGCDDVAAAATCFSPFVRLYVDAVGAATMAVSNDQGFAVEDFEPFQSLSAWLLQPGDGAKTVYLRLRDEAGNVSDTFEANITLDTEAPVLSSVTLAGGADVVNVGPPHTVDVDVVASGATHMQVAADGVLDDEAWVGFAGAFTVDLPTGDGIKPVAIRLRDEAGNVTAAAGDTVRLDTAAPAAPTVVLRGSVGAFSNEHARDPTVTATIAGLGIDVADVRFVTANSGQACGSAGSPTDIDRTSAIAVTFSGDGTHRLCVAAVDAAGNASAWGFDQITVDTTPPGAPTLSPNNIPQTNHACADITPSGSVDSNFWKWQARSAGGAWVDAGTTNTAIEFELLQDATNQLEVRAVDRAGNVGDANSVTVEEVSSALISTSLEIKSVCDSGGYAILKQRGVWPVGVAHFAGFTIFQIPELALLDLVTMELIPLNGPFGLLTRAGGDALGFPKDAYENVYDAACEADNDNLALLYADLDANGDNFDDAYFAVLNEPLTTANLLMDEQLDPNAGDVASALDVIDFSSSTFYGAGTLATRLFEGLWDEEVRGFSGSFGTTDSYTRETSAAHNIADRDGPRALYALAAQEGANMGIGWVEWDGSDWRVRRRRTDLQVQVSAILDVFPLPLSSPPVNRYVWPAQWEHDGTTTEAAHYVWINDENGRIFYNFAGGSSGTYFGTLTPTALPALAMGESVPAWFEDGTGNLRVGGSYSSPDQTWVFRHPRDNDRGALGVRQTGGAGPGEAMVVYHADPDSSPQGAGVVIGLRDESGCAQ